jgi:hypothetical protein
MASRTCTCKQYITVFFPNAPPTANCLALLCTVFSCFCSVANFAALYPRGYVCRPQSTHRLAMVTSQRAFHHDGKISPAW